MGVTNNGSTKGPKGTTANGRGRNGNQRSGRRKNDGNRKGEKPRPNSGSSNDDGGGIKRILAAMAGTAAAKSMNGIGAGGPGEAHGEPGVFDLFLLAQSWAPRFCCTHTRRCQTENMNERTVSMPAMSRHRFHVP